MARSLRKDAKGGRAFRRALGRKTLVVAMGVGGVSVGAHAAALDDLKAQIEALQRKVVELEQKQGARERAPVPGNVVTGGATKGSFRLPGSNTSVTLGGYAKLDAVFSNPSAGVDNRADLQLDPSSIPVGPAAGQHERNQVKFGARETRLFVKTNTPTAFGDLDTHVEFDFYGADGNESVSNSHGLRLRHAYAKLGKFLAGQTWTTFMNPGALPETLDFGGPAGQVFERQTQIRWTESFAGLQAPTQWSIALENPETVVQTSAGSLRADDDHVPDFTGQVAFDTARGKFSVHGLLRQIRVDTAVPALTDQKWGGALALAGSVPTIGKDDVRFTASVGNGIGRYANGFFPDAVLDDRGRLGLPTQWLFYTGYRHFWTDSLRSSLVVSMASENNPAGAPADTNKRTRSAHVNLIWSPVENTDLGMEYIRADRETEDGSSGHLDRVQLSAKYAF
ncbi:MAG: DcaP family trimeric outer membrane transporter [Rudaea sp.]